MKHILRTMYILVVVLLAALWERALQLGAAYNYVRGPAANALRECDWGQIIVASALLLPLCILGLATPTPKRTGGQMFKLTLAAMLVVPTLALGLFLQLGFFGYVD